MQYVTFLMLLGLVSNGANAQAFPTAYVYSEKGDADNTACLASPGSAVAAVQAALRSSNIGVETSGEAYSYMQAYVTVNAVKLPNICAATFDLKFQNYQQIVDEYTKKEIFATVVYCNKSFTVTGETSFIYTTMLNTFKDMTNKCISEYYQRINK